MTKISIRRVAYDKYNDSMLINIEGMEGFKEYRLTRGEEKKEISQMRKAIEKHLANGGTAENFHW